MYIEHHKTVEHQQLKNLNVGKSISLNIIFLLVGFPV